MGGFGGSQVAWICWLTLGMLPLSTGEGTTTMKCMIAIAGLFALLTTTAVEAQETAKVRVNVFPGVQNLAIFAAQAKGFFARRKLEVELQFTPNSPAQREGLAKGTFEIAHAGVDNSVALADTGVEFDHRYGRRQ